MLLLDRAHYHEDTVKQPLPDLSRFELQCLRLLWTRGEASVRNIHSDIPDAPTYSTVRKIVERLEQKGVVTRVRLENKAWIYAPTVSATAMIRKEIRRFLDTLFGGSAASLVAHLANMDALTVEDLQALEASARAAPNREQKPASGRKTGRRHSVSDNTPEVDP